MSLNKAIEHGKERRKRYKGSKAFDYSCHNHKSCGWCRDTRLYNYKKEKERANQRLNEYYKGE